MTPPTTVVVKSFLLNASGKVLLLKREPNDDRRPGQWDVPGGSVDPGEDLTAAVVREIREETDLEVSSSDFKPIYAQTIMRDERATGGEYANIIRLCFVVHQAEYGTVTLSAEHDEYRWTTIVEALELLAPNKWGNALKYLVENNLISKA